MMLAGVPVRVLVDPSEPQMVRSSAARMIARSSIVSASSFTSSSRVPSSRSANSSARPDERASSDALAVFVRCATIAYPSETPE